MRVDLGFRASPSRRPLPVRVLQTQGVRPRRAGPAVFTRLSTGPQLPLNARLDERGRQLGRLRKWLAAGLQGVCASCPGKTPAVRPRPRTAGTRQAGRRAALPVLRSPDGVIARPDPSTVVPGPPDRWRRLSSRTHPPLRPTPWHDHIPGFLMHGGRCPSDGRPLGGEPRPELASGEHPTVRARATAGNRTVGRGAASPRTRLGEAERTDSAQQRRRELASIAARTTQPTVLPAAPPGRATSSRRTRRSHRPDPGAERTHGKRRSTPEATRGAPRRP